MRSRPVVGSTPDVDVNGGMPGAENAWLLVRLLAWRFDVDDVRGGMEFAENVLLDDARLAWVSNADVSGGRELAE